MSEPENEIQRLYREIREKRDRADALVKAALARAAADPRLLDKLALDPAELAERSRLRLPDLEARISRLERQRGMGPSESH
jgi:hypothetical protein